MQTNRVLRGHARRIPSALEVERAFRFLHGPDRDAVGVYHGRFQACVAQKLLNHTNVVIRLQEMGCEGVAEGVAGDSFRDFRLANGWIECSLKVGFVEMPASPLSGLRRHCCKNGVPFRRIGFFLVARSNILRFPLMHR